MSDGIAQVDGAFPEAIAPPEGSPRSTWSTAQRPVLIGLATFAVVLLLRYAGVLHGPAAIGIVVLCFIFAPGPRRVSDRFLLLFALGAGWLPLLGWVPSLGTTVDVPGVLLAMSAGVVCGYQILKRRNSPRAISLPSPAEIAALVVGAGVTLWWARPFSKMSYSGILQILRNGQDNDTHFAIFRSNLQSGSFIQVHPSLPGGASRLGYDYPQGMHQAWAQFIRLLYPHPPSSLTWLLHSYLDMLLLTTGAIVLLGCMAVCRLCRRDLLAAIPAMAIIVALFGLGRFAPFNGFPNFELSVAAAAVAVTLMVRPTMGPKTNFFAVAGLGLIVVYNWYPIIIVIAPAIIVAALRARSGRSRRERQVMTGIIVATALLYLLPVGAFGHRGVSFLNATGGGIYPSWGLLVLSIAALLGVAIVRQASNPDLITNLIIGATAVLGGGAVVVLAAYEYRSVHSISYYGQKFATGVLGVCLIVLVCVLASQLASAKFRQGMSAPMVVMLTALLTVAALQVDGYAGPFYGALQSVYTAPGILVHNDIAGSSGSSFDSEQLLQAAQAVQATRDKDAAEHWWYLDPTPLLDHSGYTNFGPTAQWFLILRGDPANVDYYRSTVDLGNQLDAVSSPTVAAATIIRDFPGPVRNHFHLFVPDWLKRAMIHEDPIWGRPGLLRVIPAPAPA